MARRADPSRPPGGGSALGDRREARLVDDRHVGRLGL
jgi:hypothetical protein